MAIRKKLFNTSYYYYLLIFDFVGRYFLAVFFLQKTFLVKTHTIKHLQKTHKKKITNMYFKCLECKIKALYLYHNKTKNKHFLKRKQND